MKPSSSPCIEVHWCCSFHFADSAALLDVPVSSMFHLRVAVELCTDFGCFPQKSSELMNAKKMIIEKQ